jgi:cytochrome P450
VLASHVFSHWLTQGANQFGAGSRSCIGKNISLLEISKVLPQIVRSFNITVDEKDKSLKQDCYWFVKQHFHVRISARHEDVESNASK